MCIGLPVFRQSKDAMFKYYVSVIGPAVKSAGKHEHIAHQFIEAEAGKWLLIANYASEEAANAYATTVQELINPGVA